MALEAAKAAATDFVTEQEAATLDAATLDMLRRAREAAQSLGDACHAEKKAVRGKANIEMLMKTAECSRVEKSHECV